MDETDRGRDWIDKVNRAAIGHMNAERDSALIGNEAIATGEFFVERRYKIDPPPPSFGAAGNRDLVAVDLFSGEQRPIRNPDFAANFKMRGIETAQRFGFVVRDVDAGNASRKDVNARLQGS